jgi:hypothetical protein
MLHSKLFALSGLMAALLLTAGGTAAAQAKLTDFVGKVEIKPPNGNWTPARKGMTIAAKSMVSTGFKSKVTLELDQSTLFVNQLTRLSIEEIARTQGVITTNINIRAGSLAADIKTGGTDYKHDFKVKSPVSTAAVRGTRIVYDGYELSVTEGTALLFNLLDQPMTVFKGEAALTGTGLNLVSSRLLRDFRFRIKPALKRALGSATVSSSSYISDSTIVVFYTIW